MAEQKEKKKQDGILDAGIVGAGYETTQRYGAAVKEHLVAYSGTDYEHGIELQKSLKSIKQQATNEEYAFAIRQQKAGWAAEVKDTAKTNAENIINHDDTRKVRYDDLPDTSANHPLFDHASVDAEGNVIAGSGSQMKFIGASAADSTGAGNAQRALQKLQSKDFQKYIDHDVTIEVPKDEYQQMMDLASEQIETLQKQLEQLRANGNLEAVAKIEQKIETLKKLKQNLRPSKLTRKEALQAVDTPEVSTLRSVVDVSHRAGMEMLKNAALIGGGVSLVRNIVQTYKGEIEIDSAIKNVVIDTTKSSIVGYGTGFAGSAIKGVLQNAKSEGLRTISKTNLPATMVSMTINASKTLKKYFSGEIDGTQCLEDLGEQGTGIIASSVFSVIGQAVIPNHIIGGLVGGMVGYALSSAVYGVLVSSLKEAKMAREERIAIEKACAEHIDMMRAYRAEIQAIIETYLSDTMEVFQSSFAGIKDALLIGDVDLLVAHTNEMTEAFGGNKPFETMDDFCEKMLTNTTFQL